MKGRDFMSIQSVGGFTDYGFYSAQGLGCAGHNHKPCLVFPEEKKSSPAKTAAKVAAGLTAVALAIAFRGKIKAGATKAYEFIKPYANTVLEKGKAVFDKVTPHIDKAKAKCFEYGGKALDYIKGLVK